MKMFSAAALAGAVLLASPAGAATLLQYQFNGNIGTEATEAPINVAAGLTGANFARGAGLTASSGANSINSSGFDDFSAGTTDYYSFGFNVAAGTSVVVNQLVFGTQASGTGPGSINLLASVDGGAFATVATFAQAAGAASRNIALNLAPVSSVAFRLVAASNVNANANGTVGATGTFRVSNPTANDAANPFSINGTVTAAATGAVPETATWTMMIVGFGAAGAAVRRRRVAFAAT